jgi:hypothetical protein
MSIHACNDLPSETIIKHDQKSLDIISNDFTLVKYLASGRIGHAFLLARGKELMVMKIIPCDSDAEKEIRTSCLLNKLQVETGIFPMTYGWLSCSTFPENFAKHVEKHKLPDQKQLFIYMFSQYVSLPWNNVNNAYSDTDYRIIMFLLLHGISVGRKHFDFFHQDIADGNIMIEFVDKTECITVLSDKETYEITGTTFLPRLIDFGETKLRPESNKYKRRVSDVRTLSDEVFRMISAKKDLEARRPFLKFIAHEDFERALVAEPSNYEIIQNLLRHPYFDIPQIKRVNRPEKKLKATERCVSCASEAVQFFQGTPLFICESSFCVKKMAKVSCYMKK